MARETGLDVARFKRTTPAVEAYQAVLHDYAEGAGWFGVSALSHGDFQRKMSLVGAVPAEQYRLMLDWMLAGEPGGLVPIPPDDAAAGATQPAGPDEILSSSAVPGGGKGSARRHDREPGAVDGVSPVDVADLVEETERALSPASWQAMIAHEIGARS